MTFYITCSRALAFYGTLTGSLGLSLSTFYGTCTRALTLSLRDCNALAFETFRLNVLVAELLDEFISYCDAHAFALS